ncbi:MAG: helix-turn-helix transcriptional regulator [Gracilimonas sp.]
MHSKEEIQEALSIVIKRHRDNRDLSQFDLAMESDLHRTMVEFIERRKRMPTVHSFMKLAEGLSIDASELLKEVQEELKK